MKALQMKVLRLAEVYGTKARQRSSIWTLACEKVDHWHEKAACGS
jgi:hypothetical protein